MAEYDIFISFKNSDDPSVPCRDVEMAESLYHALRAKGYSPFFSKYSVDESGRSNYMTIISTALEQAKVFVAVGTTREKLTSDWVSYEIEMFSNLWLREKRKTRTIITYRSEDFPANTLPPHLAIFQSFDNEAALVRLIDISLQKATGFRHDGDNTSLLYEEDKEISTILGPADPVPAVSPVPPVHTPPEKGLKLGDILDGRYEILHQIGQGGFSRVFLAKDRKTEKVYAVKEVRNDGSVKDFRVVEKALLDEVALLKKCDHPAFPKLYDLIQTGDSHIVVMEYIQGSSLQKALKQFGPESESRVLDVAKQLCNALSHLHSRPVPIIYRDLKPANIMMQPNGNVKLIDFGTAREFKTHAVEDTTCLGTVGYAAPEQFGGMGQTDARTDIYNLGVTLYHLVTGKSPAEPPYEILPIRKVNPDLSAGLEFIIQKCTQKDPKQRYQSETELLEDLENVHKLGKRFTFKPRVKKKPTDAIPAATPVKRSGAGFIPTPPVHNPGVGYTVPIKPPTQSGFAVPKGSGTPQAGFTVPKVPVASQAGYTIPGQEKPQVDPRLADAMAKLITLDPASREIVLQLIDRLSK